MFRPIVAVCAVVVSGAAACSGTLEESGIQVTRAAVEAIGEAPDSVIFSVTFVNLSREEITFRGAGKAGGLDMEVRDSDGELVWRHLRGVVAAGPAAPYAVPSGRTETWTVAWPIVDTAGARVPPGTYSVVGFFGDDLDVPIRPTGPVSVTVNR
jgi:hypothetical protein